MQNVVNLLVFLSIGAVVILIYNIRNSTLSSLQKTDSILSKVAERDLTPEVETSSKDEVGQMMSSLSKMINGMRQSIGNVSQVQTDLTATSEATASIVQMNNGIRNQEIEGLLYSINEMNEATANVVEASSTARKFANEGGEAARKGKATVANVVESINQLAAEVEESAQGIHQIEENSENIDSVVQMIQDITEQTNLLALNAAIEAARAGEQGRGFAVVADEVRTLAQRTQTSTREIQEMVGKLRDSTQSAVKVLHNSQERAKSSVEKANEASGAIEAIVDSVSLIVGLNEEIAHSTEKQFEVANAISKNTETINQFAEESAITADKATQSSEAVSEVSQQLESVVKQFKL